MPKIRPQALYLGPDATSELIQFSKANGHHRLLMVVDQNTYTALGKHVYAQLEAHGIDCKLVLFDHADVVADAHHILEILIAANGEERTLLAIGSGTITDLTRFSSHRMGVPFISMPTAPSVDGFTSIGAPTIVRGIKKTLISQPPIAIFADIHTLAAAPRRLLAAGFGDMMGKFTSAADFELGHLLWDEPYDLEIARRTRAAGQICVDNVDEIAAANENGISILFEALVESGYCMLDFGESRPASGAEHHMAHFIEMKLLQKNLPPILHGAKVGAATIRMARLYDALKALSMEDVASLMRKAARPERLVEEERICEAYGSLATELIKGQTPFIGISIERFESIQQRILENWPRIYEIAAKVPSAAEFTQWIEAVGGAVDHQDLGIPAVDFEEATHNGHYLRERFTVRKLAHLFLPHIAS